MLSVRDRLFASRRCSEPLADSIDAAGDAPPVRAIIVKSFVESDAIVVQMAEASMTLADPLCLSTKQYLNSLSSPGSPDSGVFDYDKPNRGEMISDIGMNSPRSRSASICLSSPLHGILKRRERKYFSECDDSDYNFYYSISETSLCDEHNEKKHVHFADRIQTVRLYKKNVSIESAYKKNEKKRQQKRRKEEKKMGSGDSIHLGASGDSDH